MGVEYHIKFQKPKGYDLKTFLAGLENPKNTFGSKAFTAKEIKEGLYFCDHCWSEKASVAFKRIVDEMLYRSDKVIVEDSEAKKG